MSGFVVGAEQAETDPRIEIVQNAIKSYEDFPKPGIVFMDIFAVFADPTALQALFGLLRDVAIRMKDDIDVIVGLDSRGFLLGPVMANAINKPFVPVRKAGKLPGSCTSVGYSLEYGNDRLELQQASLKQADRVLIVDDLLATGGTLSAAVDLVKLCGGEVVSCWVLIELLQLQGRDKVSSKVESLIKV